jgi:uncharacterized protein (UPF0261 family)/ABC-type branched-subunit amino acid transport system ATPase component
MAWFGNSSKPRPNAKSPAAPKAPVLVVEGLDVFYGRAHVLQKVSLRLDEGVLGIVGRNGMGKTTLCNAITGLVPAGGTASGSVKLLGEELLGKTPHQITRLGIAYVPQGRRMWPSLSVDETLKLVAPQRRDVDRIYSMFPRLGERKNNGGGQLSGGEQQMLAIGRALLLQPRVLVMDEPTEGLAPVIVEQVAQAVRDLAAQGDVTVLLIEQNLGVALAVADRVGVMVNGRITQEMPAATLSADRELQERLLGVRAADVEDEVTAPPPPPTDTAVQVLTVRRAHGDGGADQALVLPRVSGASRGFNRWGVAEDIATAGPAPSPAERERAGVRAVDNAAPRIIEFPVAASSTRAAYVAGTFDTKGRELFYIRQCLEKLGLRVVTVDLSTSGKPSSANVHPREVARHHPGGEKAVFSGDRGTAVAAMAQAFEAFVLTRRDIGGVISAGGSGGTSLATPGMRALPIGVPKVMVSTMASGDTRPYVGPSDICMMYSVTDVQGINRISEKVLANAAHALAGMITHPVSASAVTKPALGLTMFGVTTPCVQAVSKRLTEDYDCLVFHATGVGGQSMEKLAESGLLAGVIDVSTTEIADEIVGGVLSAGPTRLDVFSRSGMPYVGSCGALDMVNFGAFDSVPERFKNRKLYRHNPTVTLMRTTAEECRAIGEFIAKKLNAMNGPVRFLIPEAGVSAIDKAGQPFQDAAADQALFGAIEQHFRPSTARRLQRLPLHINDEAFADALVAAWREVAAPKSAHNSSLARRA